MFVMRIFCRNQLLAILAVIVVGVNMTVPSARGQDTEVMSETLKKTLINQLLLKAYQTDDPAEKIKLYDQVLNLDPSNEIARQEIAKSQAELDKKLQTERNLQVKHSLLQMVDNALASGDDAALTKALGDLDEAIKTNPGDKDLVDARQRIKTKLDQRNVSQQVRDAIKDGHDAYFAEDSALLVPALRAIDDALKVDSKNVELQGWKQKIETRIRTERFRWWLKTILLILAIVSVIGIGLYLLLRKRQGILEFADGDRTGEVFPLDKPATKIGALPEANDLVVTDGKGKISRYHCEIVREGRRYFIKDASTNGTSVNEEWLEAGRPKVLRKGDRLSLAGEVTLIFRLK